MPNALIARLSHGAGLDAADRKRLRAFVSTAAVVPARTELSSEGERPMHVHMVLEGMAARTRLTSEGRRAIMGLILPGDICDLHVFLLDRMDHTIVTLSACRVLRVPSAEIDALTSAFPRIARALWWSTLVDASVMREWLAAMGQRRSDQRMAHLLCELQARLRIVGRADAHGFELPVTVADLADVLGLSPMQVHRSLKALREGGYVTARPGTVAIPDLAALQRFADFEDGYLHLRAAVPEAVG